MSAPAEPKHMNDLDLLEEAYGVIANGYQGRWSDANPEWREAAMRFRDLYLQRLKQSHPAAPPSEAPATPTPKQRLPRCHEVYCILDDDHPGPCADKPDSPFRDAAAARPEPVDPNRCDFRNGLGQCVLLKGHQMPHMGAEDCKPSCTACPCETCQAERAFVQELARREVRVAPLLDKLFRLLDSADAEAWTSPNCTLDAARRVING